jgi:hypothetical protein
VKRSRNDEDEEGIVRKEDKAMYLGFHKRNQSGSHVSQPCSGVDDAAAVVYSGAQATDEVTFRSIVEAAVQQLSFTFLSAYVSVKDVTVLLLLMMYNEL